MNKLSQSSPSCSGLLLTVSSITGPDAYSMCSTMVRRQRLHRTLPLLEVCLPAETAQSPSALGIT